MTPAARPVFAPQSRYGAGRRGDMESGGFAVGNATFAAVMLHHQIAANYAEYLRLFADPNYTNVQFNAATGALMAAHTQHCFDPTIGCFGIQRGDYERITARVLYENGHSVILESEQTCHNIRAAEGTLDGKLFEIKGIEGTGRRNIIDKMSEAGKKGVETLVLYYHNAELFNILKVVNAYKGYINLSKNKHLRTIYCIVNGELLLIDTN